MCATAFHVVEDLVEFNEAERSIRIRKDVALAALEFPGIVFGTVGIPRDWWRALGGLSAPHVGLEEKPFQAVEIRNFSELAALWISPVHSNQEGSSYFPVNLRSQPKVGEKIMALGYADLDVDKHGRGEKRPMEQYIYGSIAEVLELVPADFSRGRAWPMARVRANWPGGMSGGPVFSQAGHVIGLVSTGFPGEEIATAAIFAGWNIPEQTFPTLDPVNPGWFHCLGVFDLEMRIRWVGADQNEATEFSKAHGWADCRLISFNPLTREHVTLQNTPATGM